MLQKDEPKDYVIATGRQFTVRDFILWSLIGLELNWILREKDYKRLGSYRV